MQKLTINKRSLLRVLLGIYLFPLWLVIFSLSVPPADLPLCGLMFVLAVSGLVLARRASRAWRIVWIVALSASIILGVLEIIAGRNMAHHLSKHESSMRLTPPNKFSGAVSGCAPEFSEMFLVVLSCGSGVAQFWGR